MKKGDEQRSSGGCMISCKKCFASKGHGKKRGRGWLTRRTAISQVVIPHCGSRAKGSKEEKFHRLFLLHAVRLWCLMPSGGAGESEKDKVILDYDGGAGCS